MTIKNQSDTGANFTMAVKHLSVRLRKVLQDNPYGLNMTHVSILFHLHTGGPTTTTALASSERISQQAVSQIIAIMKDEGWIETTPDKTDARKTLLSITKSGENLRSSLISHCDEWISKITEELFDERERSTLTEATSLLERLAGVK